MAILNWDGLSHYDFKMKAKITEWLNGKAEKVHTHTKSEVGLDQVDNTADVDKPISTVQKKKFDAIDTAIDGKGTYSKPSGGIPKSDLASTVQTSLGKADTALQSHQDISGKQDKSTAVTHKASTAVGSATQPVYIAATGTATATTYTLGKSVPSDAKFTDTVYDDATTSAHGLMTAAMVTKLNGIASGANKTTVDSELSSTSTNPVQNKVINTALAGKANSSHGNHVPATQTANNATFLRNDNTWAKVTPANIGAQPAGSYAATSHTHDDRYYTETEMDTKLNGKANSSHTHGNGDITSLDAGKITSGTISIDRLPQGALERLTVVADDTARFKLTSSTIQKGDTVKVTSTGKMYYVVDETKLSSEAGYEVYAAGTAASVPWSGVTGKPSTYTPSSHTHTKSQITDFPSSIKNPNSLTISLNGTSQGAYDGSTAKSIDVTPSSIGAATSGHTHHYAGSSYSGGAATKANGIVVSDTRNENPVPSSNAFNKNMMTVDFKINNKINSPTGFSGTFCGVLSLAPWNETSGGHGYQLAFGYADTGHPRLALRGSDLSATSWDSWYKVYTSDDKPTLSELGAAAASHTHTKTEVGLGNVDNTADANKSVKYATSAGSAGSATKVNGHTVNSDVPANAKFTDTHTDPVLTKTASTTVGAMWYE